MENITFVYQIEDNEFASALNDEFSENVDIVEVQRLNGNSVYNAIVTLSSIVVIADFIMKYFAGSNGKKRFVLIKKKEITMEGYSKNEIIEVLKTVVEEEVI